MLKYYFEPRRTSLPSQARGTLSVQFSVLLNLLEELCTSKRWKKNVGIACLWRIQIPHFQVYGRNLKLASFSQLCGCNVWRLILASLVSMHCSGTPEQEEDSVVLIFTAWWSMKILFAYTPTSHVEENFI